MPTETRCRRCVTACSGFSFREVLGECIASLASEFQPLSVNVSRTSSRRLASTSVGRLPVASTSVGRFPLSVMEFQPLSVNVSRSLLVPRSLLVARTSVGVFSSPRPANFSRILPPVGFFHRPGFQRQSDSSVGFFRLGSNVSRILPPFNLLASTSVGIFASARVWLRSFNLLASTSVGIFLT